MSLKQSMSASLSAPASRTQPGKDPGLIRDSGNAQLAMELRPYLEHREIVYAALRDAVEIGWEKQESFGDDVDMGPREISTRLKHGDCSKGYPQLAPIDFVARLAMNPVARQHFLSSLAAEWGFALVPLHPLTDSQKLKLLASELTEKRRRQLEREHHLADGELDP